MDNKNQSYASQFYPGDNATGAKAPLQQQAGQGTTGNKNTKDSDPLVQLPKGGRAIKGIGEKFQANPLTGTAGITVPLSISPGRAGFAPQLSLSYDSGSGNGAFGLGWSIGLPSITRKTDKGLPRYFDPGHDLPPQGVSQEGEDTFILSGAEDLVPLLNADGSAPVPEQKTYQGQGYSLFRYRPRTEGLFAKIEKWVQQSDGDTHWRATTKDNITTVYGDSPQSRIADPDNQSHVFQWLIRRTFDVKGNVIVYQYKQENQAGVDNEIYEKNRLKINNAFNMQYLKGVYYGNAGMYADGDALTAMDWHFQLVLDYGEHDATAPMPDDDNDWLLRTDAFSTFRAGFDIRTYRLCRRLLMFHSFEGHLGTGWKLTKATQLDYNYHPALTTLAAVTHKGYRGSETASYPPVEFNYTQAGIDSKIHSLDLDDLENLPAGTNTPGYRWIDLFGEGLNGILVENDQAWYYKPNNGNNQYYDQTATEPDAELGAMVRLASKPSLADSGLKYQLGDLNGNGQTDLAIFSPRISGYHEMGREDQWENFIPFKDIPNINFDDPQLRMIDLNGDGHADVLITENDCFTTYYSKAKQGYGPAHRIAKDMDENQGPAIVFNDGTQSIFTADMSGDGLTDIVRIRNGAGDYWPNKGYGRFGQKISLKDAPHFDFPDLFDPTRIRLADVDGSGTIDIIYLSAKKTFYWKNLAGNAFSEAEEITLLPAFDGNAAISVMDLMGNGTSCIVWSSSLPGAFPGRVQYLQLTSGVKPWLMSQMNNNMGALRKMYYAPSTKFYLQDKKAGLPWITKLPFPVHVLEKTETIDEVTNTRYINRYAYHHGYFDGEEREFRGFGMVEQWDIDTLAEVSPPTGEDQEGVYTKTWFHTGFYKDRNKISTHYQTEYFNGDNDAWLLPDTTFPPPGGIEGGLEAGEIRQACRTLKGSILRQEVYAWDFPPQGETEGGGPSGVFTVEEKNYSIKKVQPLAGQKHAVFHIVENETISYNYERNTDDPRILHRIVLETDTFGNITKETEIAYPRRNVQGRLPEQEELLVKYDEKEFINEDDNALFYRVGVPKQSKSYQVYGLVFSGNIKLDSSIIAIISNATPIDYEASYSGSGYEKRLLAHSRQTYYSEDLSRMLALGQTASHALPYHTSNLAYTPGLLALVKAKNDTHGSYHNNMLQATDLPRTLVTTGKYANEGGKLWQISGRQTFDAIRFYLPVSSKDALGNTTLMLYDEYKLLITKVSDPLGDETVLENDYHTLQPREITDPNLNHTEVAFDALGLVNATAIKGKETVNGWEGDTITDPTVQMAYDLHNWKKNGLPVYVHTTARETHKDHNTNRLQSYTYSDGLGRELQTKVQAEDGLAWQISAQGKPEQVNTRDRWTATGRTLYNNKGKVVKQYEPWFSASHEYEGEDELSQYGVTPILHYDPVGRLVRTILPDHNEITVAFDAWQQKNFDQNDNNDTTPHYDTPQIQHYDTLGRLFLTQDDNGVRGSAVYYETRQQFDILSNVTAVQDAKGRWMTENIYNMTGEVVYTFNIDSGRRWLLSNIAGKPIRLWDNRHRQMEYSYDALQRPNNTSLRLSALAVSLIEKIVYGTATATNHKGQIAQHYDQSGKTHFTAYDFKGNLLSLTKQLCSDYQNTINWDNFPNLEADVFAQSFTYDALNRPVEITKPDNSCSKYYYNKAALMERVNVTHRGAAVDYVSNINYNEKGQRTEIYFGNDSKTAYTYDTETFRLTRLLTTRYKGQDILQDLNYTYDPVGNITRIEDDAQQTFYFDNTVVAPVGTYTYDALYRLTEATGRELKGLAMPTHTDFANNIGLPNPVANALQNYTQQYTYDALGNIQRMQSKGFWTRDYFYNAGVNTLKGHTSGATEYTYDAHGNTTAMPHLPAMVWDYAGRLKEATLNASHDKVYDVYDASGERVRKVIEKTSGIIEQRIYMGGYEVYRKSISGSLNFERETLRISDDRKAIANIETKTVQNGMDILPHPAIRYQYDNHLGSACLELDNSATIISYEEYHPFGTTSYRSGRTETEVSLKRYKYVGKERDEETGLYYYGARYYAGWLGRFVSVDPLSGKFPFYTPYQYSGDNPVTFYDLDGNEQVNNTNTNVEQNGQQAKIDTNLLNRSKINSIPSAGEIFTNSEGKSLKVDQKGDRVEVDNIEGMHLSQKGLDFIIMAEGEGKKELNKYDDSGNCILFCPYDDDAGNATIAYGHLIDKSSYDIRKAEHVKWDEGLTKKEAIELLKTKDVIDKGEKDVKRLINNDVKLSQNEFDALVIAKYNGGFGKSVANAVNSRETDPSEVYKAFLARRFYEDSETKKMVESNGLIKRRAMEATIFLYGNYDPIPKGVKNNEGKFIHGYKIYYNAWKEFINKK